MPWYDYKALSKTGVPITGETEAASRAAVVDWLIGLGHTPVDVIERGAKKSRGGLGAAQGGALTPRERLQVTRELASLLGAGITLERGLKIVAGLLARPKARQMMGVVLERLRGGASLARALEVSPPSFPPFYVGLVAAGEASGTLSQGLGRLATALERSLTLRERITSALLYPALLLVMTGLTFVMLFTVVLPRLKPLFAEAGATLPVPTRIVLALGDAVEAYGWLMGLLVLIGGYVAWELLRTKPARFALDAVALRTPLLLGLVQKGETAGFARTLGTLLEGGLTLPAALTRTRETVGNLALAGAIGAALKAVREGEKLSVALTQARVFPSMALELIRVGEETATLPKMLAQTASTYERDVETTLERLISLLVPAVTIVMGLLVGGLVASVLAGIMSLNELAF